MFNYDDVLAHARCDQCPLSRNPVRGRGNQDADLVIVGDNPKYHELKFHKPFTGAVDLLLDKTLEKSGELPANVWKTNAVLCRAQDGSGDDIPVPVAAYDACKPRLVAELHAVNPKLITSIGSNAAKAFFGRGASVNDLQGIVEHLPGLPAPVLPTYHPAALLGDDINKFDTFLQSIKRSVRIAQGRMVVPARNENIPWLYVKDPDNIANVLTSLTEGKAGKTLAIDVETSGLSIVDSKLLQISIGNEERGVAIEYDQMSKANIAQFVHLLNDPSFTWIIHNQSFDLQRFTKYFDAELPNTVDTMCLALGLTERSENVGLKRLSREYLNAPHYEKDVKQYLGDGNDWASVPRGILAHYAVLDTVYTARMFPLLDQLCEEEGTRELAYNLLMPAQRTFAQLERQGVVVDKTYVNTLEAVWTPKVEEARSAIQVYAKAQGFVRTVPGRSYTTTETQMVDSTLWAYRTKKGDDKVSKTPPKNYPDATKMTVQIPKQVSVRHPGAPIEELINVNSPTQLSAFLFDHLRLPPPPEGRTTGTAFRSAYPDHEFTRLHGEYQLMNRMLNTYVKGIGNSIASDGRVHPSFLLFGAVTGRLAMHNPPLQTIPREDLLANEKTGVKRFDSIKRIFVPSPGMVWGETDFAQLELRVGWHLSEDAAFGTAIMSGDFHRVMAAQMLDKPIEQVLDSERHDIKRVVFGIMYGRMAPAIAKQLGCTTETAQWYIDSFFEAAPKYHEWYKNKQEQALITGRDTTPFGRVRRWNLVTSQNRQNVLNQAVNFPIQSTASDLNLAAMIRINKRFNETGIGRVLFPVHDSINYEARENRLDEVAAIVKEEMTTWPFPSVAVLDVETKFGESWGQLEKYEYAK